MSTDAAFRDSATAAIEAHAEVELGERFRMEGVATRGPQSVVFRTTDGPGGAGAAAALKVVLTGPGPLADTFLGAAELASQMEHPHIVPVQLFGQTRHLSWYTMPLLPDPSLDRILQAGPLELKRCLRIIEQVASALQYGHRRGTAHGGVKPENIFVNDAGWTVLADFGLPGALARLGGEAPARLLAYEAPEALEGNLIPASDQYALAMLVQHCLAGTIGLARNAGLTTSPVRGALAELPPRVEQAIRRATAPAPQDRFPTVLSFLAALDGGPAPSASTFSPTPNRKPEPRVLTMEPESRTGRTVLRLVLLVLLGTLAFFSPRIWQAEELSGVRDRLDRWYDADAPDGMLIGSAAPASSPGSDLPATSAPPSVASPRADSPSRTAVAVHRPARPVSPPPSASSRPPSPPPVVDSVAPPPAAPGKLLVSATPWGILYVDGRPVGTTPNRWDVPPGTHAVRISHDGYEPYEQSVNVVSGQEIRLTGIVLQEMKR